MADFVSFQLYNNLGLPLVGATPSFIVYKTKAGLDLLGSAPPITYEGDGVYQFSPSDADVAAGVAYAIDTGAGAFPSHIFGGVFLANQPFGVFLFKDGTGALYTGPGSPAFDLYKDRGLNNHTPPALQNFSSGGGAYLWVAIPSLSDLATGISFDIDSPASTFPTNYAGNFSNDTTGPAPVSNPPVILMARSVDARLVEVIFNRAMNVAEATTTSNYGITGGLTVTKANRVTDNDYLLVISPNAAPGDIFPGGYDVTASNMHDQEGNQI